MSHTWNAGCESQELQVCAEGCRGVERGLLGPCVLNAGGLSSCPQPRTPPQQLQWHPCAPSSAEATRLLPDTEVAGAQSQG